VIGEKREEEYEEKESTGTKRECNRDTLSLTHHTPPSTSQPATPYNFITRTLSFSHSSTPQIIN